MEGVSDGEGGAEGWRKGVRGRREKEGGRGRKYEG